MENLIVKKYSNSFLRMTKISDFPWKDLVSSLQNKELDQLNFIEKTICHPQIQVYPPSTEYIRQFLKKFINELENNGIEVNELLYNKYLTLISSDFKNEEDYYRTYNINKNLKITLKETRNLIVEGTTGLRTWQASHALADYCLENLSLFDSKEILELGAGLGFTGLALIMATCLKSYTFTDHHPKVLEFLRHNININLFQVDNHEKDIDNYMHKWEETIINIKCLDWEQPSNFGKYDFIIGADILFDKRLIPSLLDVVVRNLRCNGKVIFASTIRNEETFDFFMKELGARGLQEEHIKEINYQESSSQPVDKIKIINFS